MLSVSDGVHSASVTLMGQFSAAGFHAQADAGAGTMVTYEPPANADAPTMVVCRAMP